MIKIKRGVKMHGLKTSMIKPISFLDKVFLMLGVDFVITSAIRPLKGNEKSLHPYGHAIDVRTRDLTHLQKAALLVLLIQYLGNDYDIIEYGTHFHIEYQRHLDDNRTAEYIKHFGQDKFDEVT
jgi:hypothetical protein